MTLMLSAHNSVREVAYNEKNNKLNSIRSKAGLYIMIIGDPYRFAVVFDRVDNWNVSDEDYNGLFNMIINADIVSKLAINTVISTGLFDVKEALKNAPVNREIYSETARIAHENLYELVYGDHQDYRYLVSPVEFTDEGCFVFVVRNDSGKMRIIAQTGKYDRGNSVYHFDESTIMDIVLEEQEAYNIIDQISLFLSKRSK